MMAMKNFMTMDKKRLSEVPRVHDILDRRFSFNIIAAINRDDIRNRAQLDLPAPYDKIYKIFERPAFTMHIYLLKK